MIDTSNRSKEMDAKNLHMYSIYNEFSNIGPTRRIWSVSLPEKEKHSRTFFSFSGTQATCVHVNSVRV